MNLVSCETNKNKKSWPNKKGEKMKANDSASAINETSRLVFLVKWFQIS